MFNLKDIMSELLKLNKSVGTIIEISKYKEYNDLSGLTIDYKDEEQLFILEEMQFLMDKLETVNNRINYLNKPIIYTGTLKKNSSGRYELPNGIYYTSGSSIEVLLYDELRECSKWVLSSVEHNGKDYYIVGYSDIKLQGLKARLRV